MRTRAACARPAPPTRKLVVGALCGAALFLGCAGAPDTSPRAVPPATQAQAAATLPTPPADELSGRRLEERVTQWLEVGLPAAAEASWQEPSWGDVVAGPRGVRALGRFGTTGDRFVLVAEKPTDRASAYDAALLLELAAVRDARLGERSPNYGLELWLLDPPAGQPPAAAEGSRDTGASAGPGDVRFALILRGVAASPSKLARDLNSHPVHQATFLEEARRLGLAAGEHYERPGFLGERLRREGIRDWVLLAQSGDPAHEPLCCDAESALSLGASVLAGLDRVEAQLARIDHYARWPVPSPAAALGSGEEWVSPEGSGQGESSNSPSPQGVEGAEGSTTNEKPAGSNPYSTD